MIKTFQLLPRPLLCVLSPGQGQLCTWIRSVPPALESVPADALENQHCPRGFQCPRTTVKSQIFVCLLVLARGKRAKWKFREVHHASFIWRCSSGNAAPHFLPLSINEVVNEGKDSKKHQPWIRHYCCSSSGPDSRASQLQEPRVLGGSVGEDETGKLYKYDCLSLLQGSLYPPSSARWDVQGLVWGILPDNLTR